MKIRFRKEKLSVEIIGKKRFWIGVSAGIISSVFLSMFFDYSREVFRFISIFSEDLIILPKKQLEFFDYFFASFSSVFGFGITLWIWLSNSKINRKKDRLYKRLAQTNILLTIWIFLAIIARFGSSLTLILFGMPGFDNQIDFYSEFWYLFVLIPIVIFLNNWHIVRLIYISGKWILFSFIAIIFCSFILAKVKTVDRNIITNAYHKSYSEEYNYIEKELKIAQTYNIQFDENTIERLKQINRENAQLQVEMVQNAFNKNGKVSLDTLILEKIMVHNFKKKSYNYYNPYDRDKNWSYAYPEQIYEQIIMRENNDIEVQYLFEILREMILPLKAEEPDWENIEKYSKYEMRQYWQKQFLKRSTNTIISRLVQVENKLRNDLQYEEYQDFLLDIDTTYIEKNRWTTEIILNLDSINNIYDNK